MWRAGDGLGASSLEGGLPQIGPRPLFRRVFSCVRWRRRLGAPALPHAANPEMISLHSRPHPWTVRTQHPRRIPGSTPPSRVPSASSPRLPCEHVTATRTAPHQTSYASNGAHKPSQTVNSPAPVGREASRHNREKHRAHHLARAIYRSPAVDERVRRLERDPTEPVARRSARQRAPTRRKPPARPPAGRGPIAKPARRFIRRVLLRFEHAAARRVSDPTMRSIAGRLRTGTLKPGPTTTGDDRMQDAARNRQ